MTDNNGLILLPLSGAQPTSRDLLPVSSRSKMTPYQTSSCAGVIGQDPNYPTCLGGELLALPASSACIRAISSNNRLAESRRK